MRGSQLTGFPVFFLFLPVVHEKFIFVSIFIGFYDVSLEQDLIWLVQAIGPSIASYFDVFFFF
jgi:hypothetical protein